MEQLGADRLLFGSDHPIADDYLDRAIAMLRSEAFADEERERILKTNARAFFNSGQRP